MKTITSIAILLTITGCGRDDQNEGARNSTLTLKSSELQAHYEARPPSSALSVVASRLETPAPVRTKRTEKEEKPPQQVTLRNITGKADSIFFGLDSGPHCGYVAWSAFGQGGPIGIEGRSYESFDLGRPETWKVERGGLRDECHGGYSNAVGILAAYLDLHLLIEGVEKTIRLATGNIGPYQIGDLLIEKEGVFHWADPRGRALFPETEPRPEKVVQIQSIIDAEPHYDEEGRPNVLTEISAGTVDEGGNPIEVYLDHHVSKIEIDLDFSTPKIEIKRRNTDALILKSFSADFLEDLSAQSMKARVLVDFKS